MVDKAFFVVFQSYKAITFVVYIYSAKYISSFYLFHVLVVYTILIHLAPFLSVTVIHCPGGDCIDLLLIYTGLKFYLLHLRWEFIGSYSIFRRNFFLSTNTIFAFAVIFQVVVIVTVNFHIIKDSFPPSFPDE